MIAYDLDEEIKHMIKITDYKLNIQKNSQNNNSIINLNMEPIKFTNYARIGLQNFFSSDPNLFLVRLAKGPPP